MLNYLQHLVRASLDPRDKGSWAVGGLLHISKVVLWVPVQGHLAHLVEGELRVRPDLGQVEWVKLPALSLSEGHDLDIQGP